MSPCSCFCAFSFFALSFSQPWSSAGSPNLVRIYWIIMILINFHTASRLLFCHTHAVRGVSEACLCVLRYALSGLHGFHQLSKERFHYFNKTSPPLLLFNCRHQLSFYALGPLSEFTWRSQPLLLLHVEVPATAAVAYRKFVLSSPPLLAWSCWVLELAQPKPRAFEMTDCRFRFAEGDQRLRHADPRPHPARHWCVSARGAVEFEWGSMTLRPPVSLELGWGGRIAVLSRKRRLKDWSKKGKYSVDILPTIVDTTTSIAVPSSRTAPLSPDLRDCYF